MEKTQLNYPLNKEEAEVFVALTKHPGWQVFLKCINFEAGVFATQALQLDYGPYSAEKFRFSQGVAVNLPRIPAAILEQANAVLDGKNTLNDLYDKLYLDGAS